MTATGYRRGHRIEWDGTYWRYTDGHVANHDRPCPACGETAAALDAPDPCLGYLPGVDAACCGHGVTSGYERSEK